MMLLPFLCAGKGQTDYPTMRIYSPAVAAAKVNLSPGNGENLYHRVMFCKK
jgi:hypothetical protein